MRQAWCLSLLCMLGSVLAANAQTYIIASVQDTLHRPIPYATVIINGQYGTLADTLGRFKIFDHSKNNTVFVEATAFQSKQMGHFDLQKNPTITLSRLHRKEEHFVAKATETVGYTGKGKLIQHPIMSNSNYQAGVIFPYPNRRAQVLKVKVHCAFKGSPALPVRLNIYALDANGLPTTSLMKKDLIFTPNERISWYELDITDHAVAFPESGMAVTFEPLNPSLNRKYFNKNYHLVISQFEPRKNLRMILRTDYAGNWFTWRANPYAISLTLAYE